MWELRFLPEWLLPGPAQGRSRLVKSLVFLSSCVVVVPLSVDGLDQHPLVRLLAWTGSSLASLSPALTRSCLDLCYCLLAVSVSGIRKQAPAPTASLIYHRHHFFLAHPLFRFRPSSFHSSSLAVLLSLLYSRS